MGVFGLLLMFLLYPGVCEVPLVDPPVNVPEMIRALEDYERDMVQARTDTTPTIHAIVSLIDLETGEQKVADKDTRVFHKGLDSTGLVNGGEILGLKDSIPPFSYLMLVTWPVSKEHEGFVGYSIQVIFADASGFPDEVFTLVHEEELEHPKQIMAARLDIVKQLKGPAMYALLNHWDDFCRTREYMAWDLAEREEA